MGISVSELKKIYMLNACEAVEMEKFMTFNSTQQKTNL